ncbi:MAG TPA: efflux RND transporter periplasmic adaptor subunit [Anaeromyxobacteraceae bacterium]|nr:efflux RND transporter periplasmic adaptor subunit [Anaeromyxobacteraceae bacterium]
MKLARYIALGLVLAAASFVAGTRWAHRDTAPASHQQGTRAYACPMHPQYRSDRPGDCPSCGMRLEPVQEEGGPAAAGDGSALPAGAVRVSPERQQTIGVRLGVVERVSGTRTLRTTGRVAPNENAVYPLVAGADGMVRGVRGATTGSLVRKNEALLSFYASEFVNAQLSYFSGLDTLGRVSNIDGVDRFANTLRNLGVSEQQLEELRAKRRVQQYIEVVSPVDGFVLERKAALGLRCERGFEFYRIADLRRVWVLADVYENQAPFIRPGSKARITSQDRSLQLEATVSRAEPTFDEATRTLKVRLETENPGYALKPGMFVDVRFDIELPPSLAVPAEAIVDSGLRKTVFVDRGEGYFEPRAVETGWRLGDQVEVGKGLMEGERIVISGTFLIDSESRMKAASQGLFGPVAKDPVCGMEVDEKRAAAAGRKSEHQGASYYFCAEDCKKRFDAEPAKYLQAK